MITSNLLSALMLSMAVGGNTATAFIKEPQQALNTTTITKTASSVFNSTPSVIEINNDTKNYFKYTASEDTDNYHIRGNLYTYCNQRLVSNSTTEQNFGEEPNSYEDLEYEYVYILQITSYTNTRIQNFSFSSQSFYAVANWYSYGQYGIDLTQSQAYARPNDDVANFINILNYSNSNLYDNMRNILRNSTDVTQKELDYTDYLEMENEGSINSVISTNYTNNNTNTYYQTMYYIQIGALYATNSDNVPLSYSEVSLQTPKLALSNSTTFSFDIIDGYTPGGNTGNYEVIDLPNVMYTILTMPFSFVSQAFNLTIFPGTPYEVNIGNIILLILTILIVLFLVSK